MKFDTSERRKNEIVHYVRVENDKIMCRITVLL